MTSLTHTQLQSLIENEGLTVGETYVITDYSGYSLGAKAISTSELDDEWHDIGGRNSLVFHYVPEINEVDYMKDTEYLIEGNFDWTSNVSGKCYDIHFDDSVELFITASTGVYCEGSVTGTINRSSNVIVGDGSNVDIRSCSNILVGSNNEVLLAGAFNLEIGQYNDIEMGKCDGWTVGDKNSDFYVTGTNIVGSRNDGLELGGTSNVVASDNKGSGVWGDCNRTDETRYTDVIASFNEAERSEACQIYNATGNTVKDSATIDISGTNNNLMTRTNDLTVKDKDSFIEYTDRFGVRVARNMNERINMQSDDYARILLVDEQRFYEVGDIKGYNNYILNDEGHWEEIE